MIALCIDPGPTKCGWVAYDSEQPKERRLLAGGILPVEEMRERIIKDKFDVLVIEGIKLFQTVGADVRDTAYVCGRFQEIANIRRIKYVMISRDEVKIFLCGRKDTVKDPQVNESLRGYFNAPTLPGNKCGGVLLGYTSHTLAAVGVAVTWHYHYANGECYAAR